METTMSTNAVSLSPRKSWLVSIDSWAGRRSVTRAVHQGHANLYVVTVQVPEAEEAVTAGVVLDRPHTYASRCKLIVSRLNFLCKNNGMPFNVCLGFIRRDNH